jgi:hypothetical protein
MHNQNNFNTEIIPLGLPLARRIRAYLGKCPHDEVADLLAEFSALVPVMVAAPGEEPQTGDLPVPDTSAQ